MKIQIILTLILLLTAGVVLAQNDSSVVDEDKCISFGDLQTLVVNKESSNSFYLLYSGKSDCKELLINKEINQAGTDNLIWMMSRQSQDSLYIRQDGAYNLSTVFQTQISDSIKNEMNQLNTIKVNQRGKNNRVRVTQY